MKAAPFSRPLLQTEKGFSVTVCPGWGGEGDRRWRVCHCRPEPENLKSRFYIEISHEFYDTRHQEGSNLLFSDGHAKWRKKASVLVSEFGLTPKTPTEVITQLAPGDRREVGF